MPTRDEIINDKTFKNEDFEVKKRVFYTLAKEDEFQDDRIISALSILIGILHKKDILTNDDIDDLLYEFVALSV